MYRKDRFEHRECYRRVKLYLPEHGAAYLRAGDADAVDAADGLQHVVCLVDDHHAPPQLDPRRLTHRLVIVCYKVKGQAGVYTCHVFMLSYNQTYINWRNKFFWQNLQEKMA